MLSKIWYFAFRKAVFLFKISYFVFRKAVFLSKIRYFVFRKAVFLFKIPYFAFRKAILQSKISYFAFRKAVFLSRIRYFIFGKADILFRISIFFPSSIYFTYHILLSSFYIKPLGNSRTQGVEVFFLCVTLRILCETLCNKTLKIRLNPCFLKGLALSAFQIALIHFTFYLTTDRQASSIFH